ncbi:MAG TPA: hypothetical protein VGL94_04135 [Ktedonobacteraceae bacterium]|jgi:hypothetical protein
MQNFLQNLALENIYVDGGQLIFHYSADTHAFWTELYYEGVDFNTLKERYSPSIIDNLIFHIGFIEGFKYFSLFPRVYNVLRYSKFVNKDLIDLSYLIYNNVFAQHKWEHSRPDYSGPKIVFDTSAYKDETTEIQIGDIAMLFSCGGGKDSLVSMKLLERANIPYAVSQYSHSIYGRHEKQHQLIDHLVKDCHPVEQNRMYILDDFLDGPALRHHFAGKIKTLCAPETPCSIFEALPLMLTRGYNYLCIGHERDAETGSFFWEEINQEVNHQWGKSYEAELALNSYIQKNLVSNFRFFSILKPIYDFLIFQLLRKDQEYIFHTHSCNIEKPWCKRCPKCIYVWLLCEAYLDKQRLWEENLFDLPEAEDTLLQLVGLQEYRPFECVGEIDDARLAVYFCMKKGCTGKIINIFKQELVDRVDFSAILQKYNAVYTTGHLIPDIFANRIWPQFYAAQVAGDGLFR